MTSILTLQSDYGPIHIEVEDSIARKAAAQNGSGLVSKGVLPMSADGEDAVVKSDTRFDKAMDSLKAYAGTVQQVVAGLDVMPKEVTVEVGLKFAFEAGTGFFAIAKAGTEADMRVSLTWEPRKDPAA